MHHAHHRRGVVLILAVGLSAMLAGLALAFIARTRIDANEMSGVLRLTQARMMLSAACAYVLEAGRLGYDRSDTFTRLDNSVRSPWSSVYPATPDPTNALYHEEAFGWVDVRDGQIGPKTLDYDNDGSPDPLFNDAKVLPRRRSGPAVYPAWPAIGSICRAPMAVLTRPPFALVPATTPNPINQDTTAWDFGVPLLRNADGAPSLSPELPASATLADRWQDWMHGDPTIRVGGAQGAWFRLYRDSPATFIVTVGCGGTLGYRDWDEVEAANADARFGYDALLFRQLIEEEVRLWYRIEWSPAIAANGPPYGGWLRPGTARPKWSSTINQAGTISLIQRLRMQPREW